MALIGRLLLVPSSSVKMASSSGWLFPRNGTFNEMEDNISQTLDLESVIFSDFDGVYSIYMIVAEILSYMRLCSVNCCWELALTWRSGCNPIVKTF